MITEPLFEYQPEGIMTLEEMKNHEWVVPWSGGKDSTATILLMLKYGVPIKEVFNVRMMFDDDTPAVLPIMIDFVDRASKTLEEDYGIKVHIKKSRPLLDIITPIVKNSKYDNLIGKPRGLRSISMGKCDFQKEKVKTQDKAIGKSEYIMLGYGADEYQRFSHWELTDNGWHFINDKLTGGRQSILVTLGVTEAQAMKICESEGLLSPHYTAGIKRDGCFFCPSTDVNSMSNIINNYPELYKKIEYLYELNPELHNTDTIVKSNLWVRHIVNKRGIKPTSGKEFMPK